MQTDSERPRFLFKKYLNDRATPDEIREMWKLFSESRKEHQIKEELRQLWMDLKNVNDVPQKKWEHVKMHFTEVGRDKRQKRLQMWRVAASILALCVLGIAGFLLYQSGNTKNALVENTSQQKHKDLKPGGNKAVLLLANGNRILLDSNLRGQLTIQGNSKVVKSGNGKLAYLQQKSIAQTDKKIQYNTLKTPRGGQYQLVLPDGTKVWLNASSSIRFPVAFDNERVVDITGEVYMEVAPNARKPFKVRYKNTVIDVLGTSFNINAYSDEPQTTVTLLDGSLKVTNQNSRQSKILSPGQQARNRHSGNIEILNNVNEEGIMAWKNHLFWFNNDDIQTVMRQISRWYDVDVVISGEIPQHFTGFIPRNMMLSDVFKILNKTGKINYEIREDTVIVSP